MILLAFGYWALTQGIYLQNITFGNTKIERLYLKLDKKLIVSVDKLILSQSDKKPFSLTRSLQFPFYIQHYFQKLVIKSLIVGNSNYKFHYSYNHFYLFSDDIAMDLSLKQKPTITLLYINKLLIKKYDFLLKGVGYIEKNGFMKISTIYKISQAKGSLYIKYFQNKIYLQGSSKPFSNDTLRKILEKTALDRRIKEWSAYKIIAKKYRLKSFSGSIDLNKKLDLNKFQAVAIATNAAIRFHQKLPPARAKQIIMELKNDNLYFSFVQPRYLDKKLDGTKVRIYALGKRGSYIDISIKAKTPVDAKIQKLLNVYKIDLPLYQKKGEIDAKVELKLDFHYFKLHINGVFDTSLSIINLHGIDIVLKDAHMKLQDNIFFIDKAHSVIEPIIRTNLKGYIDFKKKKGKFFAKKSSINIKEKNFSLLDIQDLDEIVTLDLSKSQLYLKKLDTLIKFNKKSKIVVINDLALLRSYSMPLKKFNIQYGQMRIILDKNISFSGKLFAPNTIIVHHSKYIDSFFLKGVLENKQLQIDVNDFAHIMIAKRIEAQLKNIDLNITDINRSEKSEIKMPLKVTFENCNFFHTSHTLLSQKAELIKNRDFLHFQSTYMKNFVSYKERRDNVSFKAKNLSGFFINSLLGKNYLTQGVANIEAKGPKNAIDGELILQNSYIKDLKALNNLFAFLNTVPALLTFSDPGYSTKGMYVQNAKVKFLYNMPRSILSIKSLRVEGKSIIMQGYGVINFAQNNLKLFLDLQALQGISNVVNKIPLAGYILLGKEGTISTKVELSGPLNNPKVTTNLVKDTVKAPFNIMKRTLTLPLEIFK